MKKKLIYELKSLYRDSLRVYAYEFGEGEEKITTSLLAEKSSSFRASILIP